MYPALVVLAAHKDDFSEAVHGQPCRGSAKQFLAIHDDPDEFVFFQNGNAAALRSWFQVILNGRPEWMRLWIRQNAYVHVAMMR